MMQADAGEVWQDAEWWSPGWEVCKRGELLFVRSGLLDSSSATVPKPDETAKIRK